MIKEIAISTTCLCLMLSPVAAAEAGHNWTGFYAGLVAGGGNASTDISDDYEEISYGSKNFTDLGGLIGMTLGYNHQIGSMVLGIEADYSLSGFNQRHYDEGYDTQWAVNYDSLATIRARAGLTVERSLIYVTGGLALVGYDIKADYSPINSCAEFENGDEYGFCLSTMKTGIVVGTGAEYALDDNLSVKAEALFVSVPTIFTDDVDGGYADNYSTDTSMILGRVGLNYSF